ncbi:hypothetical protein ABW16_21520 [Mycolicibacter heraklionensis]|uniref:Uncharacterized protein n=1 Tax=Mycolicibacter heraklionensis TaxID=512402 RepID=A0ABR5FA11_9MYCO|nr:hypothetical protein [Mycolicibacter heraklionensis]KLO25895.1 hypothetical protein ABW16_21520 [Mycolicibacter heraklionensis]
MTTPTSPANYRGALREARRQIEAQKAAGRSPTALVATAAEAVIATRERAAQHARQVIRSLWEQTNPYDDASVARFAAQAARAMKSVQTAAGRAAGAAMVQQLAAAGIKVVPTTTYPLDVRAAAIDVGDDGKITLIRKPTTVDYSGGPGRGKIIVTPRGSTTEEVFRRPARAFRFAQSEGRNGLDSAHDRIDSLIDTNLMLAQRLAQQELLAKASLPPPVMLDNGKPYRYVDYRGQMQYVREKRTVTGYRRVIHPELSRGGTCGMCIAASDRVYKIHQLMPIHDNCHCTISPVTEDYDPGSALNNLDLERIYGDAGGNTVAHLKRTRYQIDEHGELGALLVPKREYKPRSKKAKQLTRGKNSASLKRDEADKRETLTKQIDVLERNLKRLRANGEPEDSSKVAYHKRIIAKFRKELAAL